VYPQKETGLLRFYLEESWQTADAGSEALFRIDVTHQSELAVYARNSSAPEPWMVARTPVGSMMRDRWNFIALRLHDGAAGTGEMTIRINHESYDCVLQIAEVPGGNQAQLGPVEGVVDEFTVFDRALSDAEIQTLLERGLGSGQHFSRDRSRP